MEGNYAKMLQYFAIEKGLKEEAKENGEAAGNARYGRREAWTPFLPTQCWL